MESNVSKSDIEKSTSAPAPISINPDDSDDESGEDNLNVNNNADKTEVKLVSSLKSPGVYGLMLKVNGSRVGNVEIVPERYLELAQRDPKAALKKIKSEKMAAMSESDEDLMESIDKHFGINKVDESDVEKGKFTSWCKKSGFEGPSIACAKKAMGGNSTSAHKMATFYMNTVQPKGKTTKDL